MINSISAGANIEIPQVEVQIFGPVRVVGAARPLARAYALDLVTYLALHRDGVTTDQWVTALWPDKEMAPATIHSTSSAARRALGVASNRQDHLPNGHKRLKLGPSVGCDLDRMASLLDAPLSEQRAGLLHFRGQPFSGLRRFDWVVAEGHATRASDVASALASSVGKGLLDLGHPDQAIVAIRRGISVNPYDESLWRLLLEATWSTGNSVGLEPILTELAVILGASAKSRCGVSLDDAAALVHPATWESYCSLRSVSAVR